MDLLKSLLMWTVPAEQTSKKKNDQANTKGLIQHWGVLLFLFSIISSW